MAQLEKFEFSEEIIEKFRMDKEIPLHFYNKDGQILIYKKEEASPTEIERILRFVDQGIYFDIEDRAKLGLKEKRSIPEGLSDTKLLSDKHAEELLEDTGELFDHLKRSSLSSIHAKKTNEKLTGIFSDFENQPDAMTGLVNIIELMNDRETHSDVELAVKRTVVAMSLKTRGMHSQTHKDEVKMKRMVSDLMMSAMLCDVGTIKMEMPANTGLNSEQRKYISNHPLMSYLMIAHDPSINSDVKHNVLCHHRPLKTGMPGNNFPETKWLLQRLLTMESKYRADPSRKLIADDILIQVDKIRNEPSYNEDVNILAVASEFASLTSKVAWRDAFSPVRTVKMIVNNSYFTYTDRIIREFLDHVAISLCDNQKVIGDKDFIIVAARSRETNRTHFEVCQVSSSNRYQSRPHINRIATIFPQIVKAPKMQFLKFDTENIKPDPRHAHYDLANDQTRHIVFIIDPERDTELFEALTKLVNKPKKSAQVQ